MGLPYYTMNGLISCFPFKIYMYNVCYVFLFLCISFFYKRSKLTFSKSRLLATFNCKMVAIR